MQGIISIAKLIPIIAIIALGFIKGTAKGDILNISSSGTVSGFGAALLGTLWAYDGWISVGNMAGELKILKRFAKIYNNRFRYYYSSVCTYKFSSN